MLSHSACWDVVFFSAAVYIHPRPGQYPFAVSKAGSGCVDGRFCVKALHGAVHFRQLGRSYLSAIILCCQWPLSCRRGTLISHFKVLSLRRRLRAIIMLEVYSLMVASSDGWQGLSRSMPRCRRDIPSSATHCVSQPGLDCKNLSKMHQMVVCYVNTFIKKTSAVEVDQRSSWASLALLPIIAKTSMSPAC